MNSHSAQPPIRVCMFLNSAVRGGVEEHVLGLLRLLDRRRFRLLLACRPELMPAIKTGLPSDVTVFPVTINSPRHISEMLRLVRFLRRERVQVLHSHLFFASLFASPMGVAARVPVIVETPHIKESWRHGWKASFAIDRAISQCVDAYIAVSHSNARYLAESKGFPCHKVHVIQNGTDLTSFDPGHPVPEGLKSRLGFGESDPVLLLPGRLEPQKGHAVLLQALALLKPEFPALRLVCAGEGALRHEIEAQVEHLNLRDSVRLVGYQADIRGWLAMTDLGVLPSFFEGLPLAAMECLAAGRPMVATAVDGTPEVVVDGRTGLTVPPGDASALAAAIARMLREPGLRQSLAMAGREWVAQHFTLDRQLRQTEDLYLRLFCERTGASIAHGNHVASRGTTA